MSSISRAEGVRHPAIPGVTIFPMSGPAQRGKPQDVLVCVEPMATIPLHSHESDAAMLIAAGSGQVLSDDQQSNGKEVSRGSCVFFEALGLHGFKAGPEGLTFVSRNGGIVGKDGDWDIKFA